MLNLILGKSGSGKSTIVDYLVQTYHYKPLISYTTRPKRYPEETGHIFITQSEEVPKSQIAAETYFDGYHYFATKEQVEECDLYIIDPIGMKNLQENGVSFKSFYLEVPSFLLQARILNRDKTIDRFLYDLNHYPIVNKVDVDYWIEWKKYSTVQECGDKIHNIICGGNL